MKKISLVFQTHWDREWYLDVDTTNIRLTKILDRVLDLLDNSEIESFVLDGQVKALEDYMEVADDTKVKKVLDYIKQGKIIIGPWYVLSDEFLVSGESLIRNLELGMDVSKEYGTYQKVGYLPDTFGHISQMPQILQKFGLENVVLWRGVLPQDNFFNWEGADTSSVFVVFLKEGYYQPIVDQANYLDLMKTYITKYEQFTDYENILLTNGGDHIAPALGDINKQIQDIEKKFDIEVEHTTYEKYIDSIKDKESYQVIKGELRDNQNCYVLPNVLSTRYYLKQQNQIVEDRLKQIEALIAKNYMNRDYPYSKIIDNVWKTLLLNHPHDNICGCSIDDVHTEMETRTMKLMNTLDSLFKHEVHEMNAYPERLHFVQNDTTIFEDYNSFNIYNSTLRHINDFKVIKLFVNKESDLVDSFIVTDGNIDYTTIIISKKETRIFESPLDYFPEFRGGYEYEIAFRVRNLKGLSHKNFSLKKGKPIILDTCTDKTIENELLSITITEKGTLQVSDKVNNKQYNNLLQFYSSLDQGDEYNYSKPSNDIITNAKLLSYTTKKTTFYQEFFLTHSLSIPKELKDRQTASDTFVENTIQTKVRLLHNSNQLEFETTYCNLAKDQRTRVSFDLNQRITHHYSDTAFDIVKRTVRNEEFKAEKGKEVPVVVDPSLSMITTDSGLRFDHIGMQEYQITRNESDKLEVTMLRSVSSISKDDLHSRGGGAGPSMETPDAQMIGTYTYNYQLSFNNEPTFTNNDIFRHKLITSKGHVSESKSLFELPNDKIFVSSLRKKDKELELRLYNPTDSEVSFDILSNYQISTTKTTDFLGNPIESSYSTFLPKEIKTLRLTVDTPSTKEYDCAVFGGSIGGVRAAVKLAEKGLHVALIEETDWIGGQLTSQAVPLDEHPFIEEFGCPKSYRDFRNNARRFYEEKYNVKDVLNPGSAWVTRLSFEPKVALHLFEEMVSPYLGKNLDIIYNHIPTKSIVTNNTITQVTIESTNTNTETYIVAKSFIDATDIGSLLPVTGTEYTTGRESYEETKELHAKEDKDPFDMQPVTHVIAMKWNENNKELLEKPVQYDYFKSLITPYSDKPVLSEYGPDSSTGKERHFNTVHGRMPLWSYRQFFDPVKLQTNGYKKTTINWPQNDYFLGNIFDDEFDDYHKSQAKELTKSFVYYLQNEVPRHDGGFGYHEMQVDKDSLGTVDGLAKYPYIRESRRIKAIYTIKEQDISAKSNTTLPHVKHSVGIGCYHIDLHITTKSNQFFYDNTWPFEIPLEGLIPISKKNLLPASKNIGTTHLTNGSYRLHPVEWNIGETVGLLTYFLQSKKMTSQDLLEDEIKIKEFQTLLVEEGIELHWPEDKVNII